MTQNTERINSGGGRMGEERKPEVKGRGKGEDRNWAGQKGDKARNSDPLK